jgi:hypothetical protein
MNEITRDAIEQELNALESRLWNATHLDKHSGIVVGQTMNPFPNYDKMKDLLTRLEDEISVDLNPELKPLAELVRYAGYELLTLSREHQTEIKRLRAEIIRLDSQLCEIDVDQSLTVLTQL